MKELKGLLERSIQRTSKNKNVAVLLSGGVDSLSIAFAAQNVGKTIHSYSFHLDTHLSYDYRKAQEVSERFGWSFTGITIPTKNLVSDFHRLVSLGMKKKSSFECTYPFLYVFPKIQEKEILTGWAADGYYGNSRKAIQHFRHTKELFDEFRNTYFRPENCANLEWMKVLSKKFKKVMINPYLDEDVRKFYFQFDWSQLNTKPEKNVVRSAFSQFKDLKVNRHSNLQVNSGINRLFESLLDNKEINFRNRSRVMDICFDWHNVKV